MEERIITVSGRGGIHVVPDVTRLDLSLVSLHDSYEEAYVQAKADIDRFAEMNTGITEELQRSMERSLQHYRTMQLKSRPSENISKCISLMMDVDSRQFSKMNDDERAELKRNLDELSRIADSFKNLL